MTRFEDPPYTIVMLIDDNPIEHFVIEQLFRMTNFCKNLLTFSSAMEGLDYLREHKAHKERLPQLIFLDINMPGMSGFDFLDVLEETGDDCEFYRVVILSSTLLKDEIEKARKHHCVTDFIEKPLKKERLFEIARS